MGQNINFVKSSKLFTQIKCSGNSTFISFWCHSWQTYTTSVQNNLPHRSNGFVWKKLLNLRWYHKNKLVAIITGNVNFSKVLRWWSKCRSMQWCGTACAVQSAYSVQSICAENIVWCIHNVCRGGSVCPRRIVWRSACWLVLGMVSRKMINGEKLTNLETNLLTNNSPKFILIFTIWNLFTLYLIVL